MRTLAKAWLKGVAQTSKLAVSPISNRQGVTMARRIEKTNGPQAGSPAIQHSAAEPGGAATKGARTALSASPKSLLKNTRTRLSALRKNRGGLRRFGQILIDLEVCATGTASSFGDALEDFARIE